MNLLAIAGEAALRSVALALVAGSCIRLLRVRHAHLEKRIWSAVLVVACALPLAMLGRWPQITLTAYPAQGPVYATRMPAVSSASLQTLLSPAAQRERHGVKASPSRAANAASMHAPGSRLHWRGVLAWAYGAAMAGLLCRMLAGLLFAVRLWRKAEPFLPATPLNGATRVRVTDALQSPVTFGDGILLPREATTWSRETLQAVLVHEEMHGAEGDFYLQLAAALHLAVFPFSPLAWWLPGKLAQLSEMVCDRAAVACMQDKVSYAELLLQFSTRQKLPAGLTAMARSAGVAERVERLLADPQMRSYFRERRGQMTAAALGLLLLSAAATATLHVVRPARLVLAQEKATVPVAMADGQQPAVSDTVKPALAAVIPSGSAVDSYVIYGGDGNTVNQGAYGVFEGIAEAHRQHPGAAERSVWFEKAGRMWVIDDRALTSEALADYAPVVELGREQDALGRQQGELGSRQGQAGSQQGALGAKEGELAAEMGRIAAEHTQHVQVQIPSDFGANVSALVDVEVKLAMDQQLTAAERSILQTQQQELQAKIHKVQQQMRPTDAEREAMQSEMKAAAQQMRQAMQPLTEEMTTLAREQGGFSDQQADLGTQQQALSARQSAASAEAERKLQQLIEKALRDGKAQPVE